MARLSYEYPNFFFHVLFLIYFYEREKQSSNASVVLFPFHEVSSTLRDSGKSMHHNLLGGLCFCDATSLKRSCVGQIPGAMGSLLQLSGKCRTLRDIFTYTVKFTVKFVGCTGHWYHTKLSALDRFFDYMHCVT